MTSPDPQWLERAHRATLRIGATSVGVRGARHHLYIALLDDPRRRERFGLYVGETSCDPDVRFDQHKSGYKASRRVARFGVRLLPHLVAHLSPLHRWEAIDLEEALADTLRRGGVLWVEGGH